MFGFWQKFIGEGGSAGGGWFIDKARMSVEDFDVYRARELAAQAVTVLDREIKDLTFARILLKEAEALLELDEREDNG